MLPLCEDKGVGVIPWSPMARGRLTRDWSVTSRRTQNDAFALKMYENAALLDKPVIDVVASIAEKHAVPRAHVAIAWLLSKSVITAPIIGATKPEHLSTAISSLDFSLSDAEITELEVVDKKSGIRSNNHLLTGAVGFDSPNRTSLHIAHRGDKDPSIFVYRQAGSTE